MEPTIRSVRRDQLAAVCDLLALTFDEAAPSMFAAQTERDSTFRLRHGRVAVVDGRIAGYVRIFARTMLVRGEPVAAGGIGSVATAATARHRGIATSLLEDAIDVMRRDGMRISFLFTGIAPFYERLGYTIVREPFFTIDVAEAAALPSHTPYTIRRIAGRDVPRLTALHRSAIAGSTGAVRRTTATWRDASSWLDEDRAGCVVAEDRGRIVAYIRLRERDYGHQIIEAECASGHDDALAALIARVARRAYRHGASQIEALAPDASPLATILRSLPSTTETTDVRYPMMMRALDDDPQIADAIAHDAIQFWNADRI